MWGRAALMSVAGPSPSASVTRDDCDVPPTRPPICIVNWQASSLFGWGVYGLNLALVMARNRRLSPVFAWPWPAEPVGLDAQRAALLDPIMQASHELSAALTARAGRALKVEGPVLYSLGNRLLAQPAPSRVQLESAHPVGVVFLEDSELDANARRRSDRYDVIITGSTWNDEILRGAGVMATVKILQGVDPIVFRPSPEGHVRPPELRGCFAVFSGGKLEFRKGQDLVLRSFKRFHDRHPDSRLVTAWHSPWPNVGESLNVLGSMTALAFNRDGVPNVTGWAHDNRVPAHAFLDLDAVPNSQMPSWLRSVDVAVFPSRAEGGTNLVAMECMASAVPVILSANTGHLDLIGDDTCLVLTRQAPVPARLTDVRSTQGWGESDVDEIVEQLELAYADRDLRKRIGARGAEHLSGQTWSSQIGKLEDQLLDMMG